MAATIWEIFDEWERDVEAAADAAEASLPPDHPREYILWVANELLQRYGRAVGQPGNYQWYNRARDRLAPNPVVDVKDIDNLIP